jgi:hypothetical protein
VAGCCDSGNEHSGLFRSREFLDLFRRTMFYGVGVFIYFMWFSQRAEHFFVVETRGALNEAENYFLI